MKKKSKTLKEGQLYQAITNAKKTALAISVLQNPRQEHEIRKWMCFIWLPNEWINIYGNY